MPGARSSPRIGRSPRSSPAMPGRSMRAIRRTRRPGRGRGAGDHDTTHICAVDRDRMVVSLTQSIIDAYGSGVVVPGTGILLNSAMHNFSPVPGRTGSIAPWKRSAHNGTPVVVLTRGAPLSAIGGARRTKIGPASPAGGQRPRTAGTCKRRSGTPRPQRGHRARSTPASPPTVGRLRASGMRRWSRAPPYRPAFSRINGIALASDGTLTAASTRSASRRRRAPHLEGGSVRPRGPQMPVRGRLCRRAKKRAAWIGVPVADDRRNTMVHSG